ncbi:MAG: hypothetical protein IPI07_02990 [Flavobacteriales bacterium]|nr:hypothetical protein [Flavobacteriales bacterium]
MTSTLTCATSFTRPMPGAVRGVPPPPIARWVTAPQPDREEHRAIDVQVTGALYNDLARAGVDPMLSMQLADVFAWTVDFYRIQKGDKFTVVFLERTVDGEPAAPGSARCALSQRQTR